VSFFASVGHFTRGALGRARREVGLVAALFVIAGGLVGFGSIAEEVFEGDTSAFDRHVLLLFRHTNDLSIPIGPAWVQEMARDVTSLGSFAVLGLMVLLVLGYIAMIGKPGAAGFILASVLGGQGLSTVLKVLFQRPRPDLVAHATRVFTASFPSGHAMLSAVTYLTLGAVLTRVVPSHRAKVYVISAAVFLTLLVGVSRVYLGVHWPTDVLAGWCVGSAWAVLCWAVALKLQRAGAVEKPSETTDHPGPAERVLHIRTSPHRLAVA
jgi:undecaprenyl-diphosphatase